MKFFKKIIKFFKEVQWEFKQISWTKKDELVTTTLIVIVAAIFLATYIWIVDLGFSSILNYILSS